MLIQIKAPDRSGTQKFILIDYQDKTYIRFSGLPIREHPDILEDFLEESGIKENDLHVKGGWAEISLQRKHIKFFGKSINYGRFDEDNLRKLMEASDFEIEID